MESVGRQVTAKDIAESRQKEYAETDIQLRTLTNPLVPSYDQLAYEIRWATHIAR